MHLRHHNRNIWCSPRDAPVHFFGFENASEVLAGGFLFVGMYEVEEVAIENQRGLLSQMVLKNRIED